MRWAIGISLLLLALPTGPAARADGLLIAPSDVLSQFSEPTQIAVVRVQASHVAEVSLFISLRHSSQTPRPVTLLLPLQTVPKGFKAAEIPLRQFRTKELRPLDEALKAARLDWEDSRDRVLATYQNGGLFAGPFAYILARTGEAGRPPHAERFAGAAAEPLPRPSRSVQTQHSRTDIYEALRPEQVARLAQIPELPPAVQETLRRYAGKPFALVRLQALPLPKPAPPQDKDAARPIPPHQGIWFRFPQQMMADGTGAYRYDFPLGTGQAWAAPIGLAQVYVVAPDTLNLQVIFPNRRRAKHRALLNSPLSEAQEAAGMRRQVHVATYVAEKPERDVEIRLRSGPSEFVAERALWQKRALIGRIAFALLGAVSWTIMFAAFVWRDRWRPWQFMWATAGVWLAAQVLLLVPLTAWALSTWHAPYWWAARQQLDKSSLPEWLLPWTNPALASPGHVALRPFIWLFPVAWAGVLLGAVRRPSLNHWRRLCWAIPLAALLAGLLYMLVGSSIALRLAHSLD